MKFMHIYWEGYYRYELYAVLEVLITLIFGTIEFLLFLKAIFIFWFYPKRFHKHFDGIRSPRSSRKSHRHKSPNSYGGSHFTYPPSAVASSTVTRNNTTTFDNSHTSRLSKIFGSSSTGSGGKSVTIANKSPQSNTGQSIVVSANSIKNKNGKNINMIKYSSQKIKVGKIEKVNWVNKYLFMSSIICSMFYTFFSFFSISLIVIFDKRVLSCGDRSMLSIFYGFQRISLMFFFISRLHFSFADSIYHIDKRFIVLFVVLTMVTYNSINVWYVYMAYSTQNGFECNGNQTYFPLILGVATDVVWNVFLGSYFMYKLRQVCMFSSRHST